MPKIVDCFDPQWWGKCARCNVVRENSKLADGVCSDVDLCTRLKDMTPVNASRLFIGPRRTFSNTLPALRGNARDGFFIAAIGAA